MSRYNQPPLSKLFPFPPTLVIATRARSSSKPPHPLTHILQMRRPSYISTRIVRLRRRSGVRGVRGEAVVQGCDCEGWTGESEEGGEGGDDGTGGQEGVAEGAAVDESIFFLKKKKF